MATKGAKGLGSMSDKSKGDGRDVDDQAKATEPPHLRVESPLPDHLEELIRKVIGAAIEVHRNLGPGLLEKIYERALCYELDLLKIPYERQKDVPVPYKDIEIRGQRVDLIIAGELIVENKAVNEVPPIVEAVVISYMHAAKIRAGLILNFKVLRLKEGIKRLVL